jgi:Zn-finger nucleic acid-binding protein
MALFHHKGVALDLCRRCGGVWLDGAEIEKVTGRAFAPALRVDAAAVAKGTLDTLCGIDAVGSFIAAAVAAVLSS